MKIATGTLTVNAAFLQEIKEDNQELRRLFDECDQLFHEMADDSPYRHSVEALGQLRDQLAMHFSLEEAYGYFENALDVAPWLNEQAEQLRAEHVALFQRSCNLAELAEQVAEQAQGDGRLKSVAEAFFAFREQFEDHEKRENDLILAAFDDDIGVGD